LEIALPKGIHLPKKDGTPQAFVLRFVRASYDGKRITVYDGREEVSRWTGYKVKKETTIPVKHIEGRDVKWAKALDPRSEIRIVIPKWLAEELGLQDANNLQHIESHERSRRVQPRSRALSE
jgi:hypothetical protein